VVTCFRCSAQVLLGTSVTKARTFGVESGIMCQLPRNYQKSMEFYVFALFAGDFMQTQLAKITRDSNRATKVS
jgi:hypothetical protein